MMMVRLVCFTACLMASAMASTGTSSTSSATAPNPAIDKVVELLGKMKLSAETGLSEDQAKFQSFEAWCTAEVPVMETATGEQKEKIDMYTATLESLDTQLGNLGEEILGLKNELSAVAEEKSSSQKLREKAADDHMDLVQDYTESLGALEKAIATLQGVSADTPAAAALMQVSKLPHLPEKARSMLKGFLQIEQQAAGEKRAKVEKGMAKKIEGRRRRGNEQADHSAEQHADTPNAYEFQSSTVLQMLEDLQAQFTEAKTEAIEKEGTAQETYGNAQQALKVREEAATASLTPKESLQAEKEGKKAQINTEMPTLNAMYAQDTKYLTDTKALCKLKAEEWATRSANRNAEIKAIVEAIDKLTGEAVNAGRTHLALLSIKKGRALVQVRRKAGDPVQERLVDLLMQRARQQNSHLLMQVAENAQSAPVENVKKMINDLIAQLQAEHNEEHTQKQMCDVQLPANLKQKEEQEALKLKHQTSITSLEAEIASIDQEQVELQSQIADLVASIAKEETDRLTSKAKNEQTIREAQHAQVAVQQGINVLKGVYDRFAVPENVAFVQHQQSPVNSTGPAPEIWSEPYSGQQGESKGAIALLEVIASDFAQLEVEATTEEAQEALRFRDSDLAAKTSKALKEEKKENNVEKKIHRGTSLQHAKDDLAAAEAELVEVERAYEALKPICVDTGISYEERKQRRDAEIQSLEEAVGILKTANFGDTGITR